MDECDMKARTIWGKEGNQPEEGRRYEVDRREEGCMRSKCMTVCMKRHNKPIILYTNLKEVILQSLFLKNNFNSYCIPLNTDM